MAITIDGINVGGKGAPGLSAYRSAQLGGYTGTEEEFYAALAGGGGGIQMELLWENASPTSEFAAQTVSLDLSAHDFILNLYRFSSGGYEYQDFVAIHKVGTQGNATCYFGSNGMKPWLGFREIAVTENGVTYGGARYQYPSETTTTQDNGYVVPVKIYGIKGVTTNV